MHSSGHRTSKKLCGSISRIPRSSNRLCFHLSTWEKLQSRGRQESNQEPAGTRAPGSDRPALREYRAGPGTAAPVPRLRNHHSPHVPPVPPPLRPRIPEPRSVTQLCEWGKETSSSPRHSAAGEAWVGGHSPRAPGSTPPAANLLQSWLQVVAVRWGARPGCSARPAAVDRCAGSRTGLARPHGAAGRPSPAASSLARVPSAPRCVSLRPRPRLPAPALVSPAPRLRDSVRAARDPPRPWTEAPGDYQDRSPACTQASALEELVVLREEQSGDCSRISSWLLRLLLLRGILLDAFC